MKGDSVATRELPGIGFPFFRLLISSLNDVNCATFRIAIRAPLNSAASIHVDLMQPFGLLFCLGNQRRIQATIRMNRFQLVQRSIRISISFSFGALVEA
jgi:hypothetical protein